VADAAVERDLAEFLRAADSLSRLDTLARLEGREAFWLNRLRPGLFDSETLQSIRWVNWRQKTANHTSGPAWLWMPITA
jgi:DNA phosphorothioation-dependent restriction protein DptH